MTAPTAPPASDVVTDVPDAPRPLRILIADDDRALREGCANILRLDGHDVAVVSRGEEAIELAARRPFDVALVDLYMSPVGGLDVLRAIGAATPQTLVIVMTGNPTVASSLEALRAGAWDYLPKPFAASHLQVLIGRAACAARPAARPPAPAPEPPPAAASHAASPVRLETRAAPRVDVPRVDVPPSDTVLLGDAPAFRQALTMARRVAPTDASVMIFGESGTGKELIAQFIHRHSQRAARKLIAINCAALPETLLESEMFGHRKGAFTGADRDKPGLLEVVNGGTLFLDELGEMPLSIQAKLLRVIQDGVVRRVGSERQETVVNVRFVAATNRDPHEAIRAGLLREDLFYRLCVVPIKLPPLRQRADDVVLLARHFAERCWRAHRGTGVPAPTFSPECLAYLATRPWPGNVRQLQNVIEHAMVIAVPGAELTPDDIPLYDEPPPDIGGHGAPATLPSELFDDKFHVAKDKVIAHFEREYLQRLTTRTGGNMSRGARIAGIDRTTLYRLMEKHALRRDDLMTAAIGELSA